MRIIVNPAAGRGRGGKILERYLVGKGKVGIGAEVCVTRGRGHATELAQEAAEREVPKVVAVGGDGTVSEVVRGLLNTTTELGIIAVGTGNDVARSLNLPRNDFEAALEVIRNGRVKEVDLGLEKDCPFVSELGVGFPAAVASTANEMRQLKGSLAYSMAVYRNLVGMKPAQVVVEIDGLRLEMNCTSILIQNTPYTGGGLLVAPAAKMDDGLLDVVLVDDIGKLNLMWNFPRLYRGSHIYHPSFTIHRGRNVRVESDQALPIVVDGNPGGAGAVAAKILPRALRVITAGS